METSQGGTMIHYLAELIWTPFVNCLEYGAAAYVLGKGLIATLRDVVDLGILLLSD
jgi:hypothetical protein